MTIVTRSIQAPAAVIMIRPHHFSLNTETAGDNPFQRNTIGDPNAISQIAHDEVSRAVDALRSAGVRIHVFEDHGKETPDSVFPNNWLSTHPGGHVALYPMFAPNRRKERRADIVEMLKNEYRVQDVVDYSGLELDGLFLEGTGSMVLDHLERVAYAVRSNRTDPIALERFCTHFNYEPLVFDAQDANGTPIYHTNVLMCIATEFVMIGLDYIVDPLRHQHIVRRFEESGRRVIALSREQIENFAGNAIELQTQTGRILALSSRALRSLTSGQLAVIRQSVTPLPLNVETIEMAGGSVRCMLAGIHLSRRDGNLLIGNSSKPS